MIEPTKIMEKPWTLSSSGKATFIPQRPAVIVGTVIIMVITVSRLMTSFKLFEMTFDSISFSLLMSAMSFSIMVTAWFISICTLLRTRSWYRVSFSNWLKYWLIRLKVLALLWTAVDKYTSPLLTLIKAYDTLFLVE